jgi:uncharacterized protein (DUF2236 family)
MDDVERERRRCTEVVETVMLEAPAEAQRALLRARNMIANGMPPQTFREQVAKGLEELRGAQGD